MNVAFNFYVFQCFIQDGAELTTITKIGFSRQALNKFKNEVKEQYPNKKFEDHYERYLMVMREVVENRTND